MLKRLLSRWKKTPARKTSRPRLELLETRDVPAGFEPTGVEQVFLERLNDARANPAAYGTSIGLDLSGVAASMPLAFDPRLVQATRLHSQDMNTNRFFSHTGSNGSNPGTRMTAAGYPWRGYGESIAAGYSTPEAALKGLIIDAGVPSLGHRKHLLAMTSGFQAHREIGIGIVQNGTGPYRHYYTLDSGYTSDTRPYLTGVAYNDANSNGKYDNGEGLGGVTIDVAGVGSTTTWSSGGYSFRLTPGTYTVTASGSGLPSPVTRTVTVGSWNYRLNINPESTPAGPEIQVLDGTSDLVDGSSTVNVGSTGVGSPLSRTFTVKNLGSQTLTLGSSITVPAGFTVTAGLGSTSLASGQSTTFTVRLDAATAGTYTGQVSFTNNDGNESPFDFTLTGTVAAPLFSDNFDGPTVGPAWTFPKGNWSQSGGRLSQTSTAAGDPKKAILSGVSTPADVTVTARVRVDSWADGDYARAGVGVRTDPTTGRGYNLVFHQSGGSRNRVQFLNDGVAWGNAYTFNWSVGTWYWFKLKAQGSTLYGKVWADGQPEPTDWMFVQTGWTGRTSGYAALNGGSSNGSSHATVSFDDFEVRAS